MSLAYDQYSEHYQAAQRALAAGQMAEARKSLLLASRILLEMAEQTDDTALREDRKQRGLRLLALARKAQSGPAAGGKPQARDTATPAADEPTGGTADRWQVTEKPGIRFDDVAGLDEVKDLLRRRVILPFRNPELAQQYRRRPGGGLLLYGPPGTGKTMMAKAIATELDAPFFSVNSSDILSKWVGEAETNLKELFATARQRLPSVVFFDEAEAIIARRGGQSTVMNRLIPEFLAQVDGLRSGSGGILLLGATNRPWDLDPAALRPGRFGERVHVGLPDQPARRFILAATLGKIPCEPGIDLDDLAARTEGLSGADLQGLVDRIVDPVFERAMDLGRPIPVSVEDVRRGLNATRPSVSPKELARYEKFRREGE